MSLRLAIKASLAEGPLSLAPPPPPPPAKRRAVVRTRVG